MRNSQIEVRPIAGSIGAEIHNVDVSQDHLAECAASSHHSSTTRTWLASWIGDVAMMTGRGINQTFPSLGRPPLK